MLCCWAGDMKDHTALFSGSSSPRTTLGDATANTAVQNVCTNCPPHGITTQKTRTFSAPFHDLFPSFSSFPSTPHTLLYPLSSLYPSSLLHHFHNRLLSVPAVPSHLLLLLLLTVRTHITDQPTAIDKIIINVAIRSWQYMVTCFDPFMSSSSHTLHKTNTTECLIFMLLDGDLNLATYK